MDLGCLFLFTSQQCHAHSIYLHVLNWTAKDLGGLLSIRHSARSSFWILKRLSPWSNSFGFEALPIWKRRRDILIHIIHQVEGNGRTYYQNKDMVMSKLAAWSLPMFAGLLEQEKKWHLLLCNQKEAGINHWQLLYRLVISNLYTYFGASINTLVCCWSMSADGRTFWPRLPYQQEPGEIAAN